MSLRLKANLLFGAAIVVTVVLAVLLLGGAGARDAQAAARREAALLTAASEVAGDYTSAKITPLLAGGSVVFVPASAPFYAVETQAAMLAHRLPGDTISRVVLDPVGRADRPDAWARDAIARLRAEPDPAPFTAIRTDGAGVRDLVLVTPLRFSPGACATCYVSRAAAPVGLVDAFGGASGFDRKPGEIVGATIASVPIVHSGVSSTALSVLVIGALLLWAALNAVLEFAVLRPLSRVAAVAEQVSLGRTGVEEFDTAGRDEIGALTRSFNRLRRSMESAIGLLET